MVVLPAKPIVKGISASSIRMMVPYSGCLTVWKGCCTIFLTVLSMSAGATFTSPKSHMALLMMLSLEFDPSNLTCIHGQVNAAQQIVLICLVSPALSEMTHLSPHSVGASPLVVVHECNEEFLCARDHAHLAPPVEA